MRFLQVHLSVRRGGADVSISNLKMGLERSGHLCSVVSEGALSAISHGNSDLVIFNSFSPDNKLEYERCLDEVRRCQIPHVVVMHDYWPICRHTNLVIPNMGWKRCPVESGGRCSTEGGCMNISSIPLMSKSMLDTNVVCFTRRSSEIFRASGFINVHTIPHGVDTYSFRPGDRASSGPIRVLFTNAWGSKEIKGYLHWEWLKRKFDGDEKVSFHEMLGKMGHRDMPSFLMSGDVMLFMSLWEETFGLVVAESMSCGTPVISYPVGIAPEMIDGHNGVLIPSSNPADVAEAILSLSKRSPSERSDMRNLARETVMSSYTVERMAEDYIRLARELRR